MTRYVYEFSQGGRDMADLLGGKGANLAEMTRLGLPVPPGFTVTTEACREYLATGEEPGELASQVAHALVELERHTGRELGGRDKPLLLSVRSGSKFSMPGMMETILDIGLGDASVLGLAKATGSESFAWDSYRRLLQMYGRTVLGIAPELFDRRGSTDDPARLVEDYKQVIRDATGEEFPQDPGAQLYRSIRAVFRSWNSERARLYRRREHIPDDLGTAVNIQVMVFGNLGPDSGTGVAFTRDPATGARGVYGDYLQDAQGEDVVAGIRNAVPLAELERLDPPSYRQLIDHMSTLEHHYRDLCDIEFTIERGTLWMLQTRVGKRTAEAAFRIAEALVDEELIGEDEALARVSGAQLARLMFPRFEAHAETKPLAHGVPASPGAAVGAIAFDSAEAVLTSRGGKTSHAAVVARGMGKVCVCGAEELTVDVEARTLTAPDRTVLAEGTVLSVDGTAGTVHLGALPLTDSPVGRFLDTGERDGVLTEAVARTLEHADSVSRLGVRANADTPEDAARARRYGAEGIGLCRTEHMFLGERRVLVESMILAEDESGRRAALDALLPLQRADFAGVLAAMDGLPVTIRLIDPPLHEFLPDRTELAVRVAAHPTAHDRRLLAAVERTHESNPMLGLRGVRLGLVVPGLVEMQVRAIAEAVVERLRDGGDPRAEIMVPLVGTVEELRIVRAAAERVLTEVSKASGLTVDCPIGTMIELPRAALTAGRIAEAADFFSFGTNDLTQTAWGLSRDDVEASFFPAYLAQGIFVTSPFETLDRDGVGRLVRIAVEEGRATNPALKIGVCGEHGGDPDSIHFFHDTGLDYVSCSPFRVPTARLEAGRAALANRADGASTP
ncbi:pyruvate, phosphate dikinase [Streptomyces sp. NBC_01764]|uniref:putative PEP-binding protein n=1 Tax=Streptomyces sp. NBC_01764 TaxID=2975935 RepID=UPI00225654BC|nr:putative PEP-binding protein [Streptomyces sp. NBC_01764]MCX4403196.1 pyruvate, phosphate dikinase [Streptomyces sp. NBC_01764]